jgi:hypothetical protein
MAPEHSEERNTQEVILHMRCAQVSKERSLRPWSVALGVLGCRSWPS